MDETMEHEGRDSEDAVASPEHEPMPAPPVDDGLPGGDEPSSSGFSWRVRGSAPAVMQSQGGIPNEFDHLFRDSEQDGRHSLLPTQGPISVARPESQPSLPPAVRPAPTQNGEPPLPTYQAPAPSTGQPQQPGSYPEQPYQERTFQQGGYQPTTQVPIGPPSDDDRNTQAIPRIPVQPYAYGASTAPSGGGEGFEPTGERRSSTAPLAFAGVIFVVLVVVAAVMLFGGSNKPASTAKNPGGPSAGSSSASESAAKTQADAIYALILQSKSLRSDANGAYSEVSGCKNQTQAQSTFTDVGTKRQAQADNVKKLPVTSMPAGAAQLIDDLHESWQYSADSENELALWAGDNLTCSSKAATTGNLTHANSDGSRAGEYKAKAAADWNAMAAALGEPTISVDSL